MIVIVNFIDYIILSVLANTFINDIVDYVCVISDNVMINVVVVLLSMVLLLLIVMLELITEATIDADEKFYFCLLWTEDAADGLDNFFTPL